MKDVQLYEQILGLETPWHVESVTLKLICGLLKADSGSVIVNGEKMEKLNGNALALTRKRMGYVFQSAALFDSISVGENVAPTVSA